MSVVDRLKNYLNEEDNSESSKNELSKNEPSSEGETADNRVHLQHIEEVEGVSISLSEEGAAAAKKLTKKSKKKSKSTDRKTDNNIYKKSVQSDEQSEKKQRKNNDSLGETARKRSIDFVDETSKKAKLKAEEGQRTAERAGGEKRNIVLSDDDEMTPKEKRREEKKRKKAAKKLEKALRKKTALGGNEGKSGRRSISGRERIRSEGADIDNLILKKATYEEAERQTVTDFCEQLVDVSYHMEDMKREYKLVTTYLEDIQRIDALPDEYRNQLTEMAAQIEQLGEDREKYLESENLLSQEQYSLLARLEKEVPGTIKNLYDMEERDTMLKSDMGYLEGEKQDLKFMRGEYADSISRIRGVMTTLLILGFITLGVIAVVAVVSKATVTVYVLAVLAFVALVFAIGYARYSTISSDVKMNDAMIAKAVSLLNKVKVKYINNTNTMEYIYDKYGVNSSNELEYSWELYNTMVRDMLRYSETNKDIRRLNEELQQTLKRFGVREPEVWGSQVRALADPREMVEVRHALNQSRQKLRENLESCEHIRSNAITALRAAVAENPGMAELIQDILTPYHLSIL